MNQSERERFNFLLEVAGREERLLSQTSERLFKENITPAWVASLDDNPELGERLEAFSARFGRLQDMIGGKLIPALLRQMLEVPGSMLDNLNRMEKLGLLTSVEQWVEARDLRNQLVHEYMNDAEAFVQALHRARQLVPLLTGTSQTIREHAEKLGSDNG